MITEEGDFRRCRIFHVVPLSFSIGFVKIILHSAAIIWICILLMRPELIELQENQNKIFECLCKNKLATTNRPVIKKLENPMNTDITLVLDFRRDYLSGLAKIRNDMKETHDTAIRENRTTQLYWALLMTTFYLLFSIMLLHGILTKNASNMLPFFCLQIFDLVIDLLWLFGHLISSRDLHKLQTEFKCLPVSKYINFMNPAISCAIILMLCVLISMIQFYLIGVVWSCYRYIIASRCQMLPIHKSNAYKNGFWGLDLWQIISLPKDKSRTKIKELSDISEDVLPKYEEVLRTATNAYNPPLYVEQTKDEKQ